MGSPNLPPLPPDPTPIPTGEVLGNMRAQLASLKGTDFQTQAENLDKALADATPGALSLARDFDFANALNSLSLVMPGVTSGVLLAVEGFSDGDTLVGVQGVMDLCASVVPAVGVVVGAGIGAATTQPQVGAGVGYVVGAIIGSIFTMISDILGFFAPKTESVAKQIQTFLLDQKAEDMISKAQVSHDDFLVWTTTLNDYCASLTKPGFVPGLVTKNIGDLNLVEGNAIDKYRTVIGWLKNKNNYSHRQWPMVLNAACNAYTILLIAVFRLQSIVSGGAMLKRYREADANGKAELKALWVAATAKLDSFRAGNRLFLEDLNDLTPAAQHRGTLWRLTAALEAGVLIDPKGQTNFGGRERKLSVTVCSKDQTLPEPPYHAYLIDWPGYLVHERVLSYSSSEKKAADQVVDRRKFDDRPDDVYATPGTDLKMETHACVYELYDGKKIVGKYRKENGDEIKTIFTPFTVEDRHKMKLTSVRAVHDPYAFEDDPSNKYLTGVRSVVYAAATPQADEASHKGTFSQILVLANRDGKDAKDPFFIGAPVNQAQGIAVDQDYLWVFGKKEFFCATHAEVIGSAPIVGTGTVIFGSPKWVIFNSTPEKQEIDCLYPCDDGTLVVSVGGGAQLWTAAYRPNSERVKKSLIDLPWTRIGNYRADGNLEKLPVFCWAQFEGLKETVETLHTKFFSKR